MKTKREILFCQKYLYFKHAVIYYKKLSGDVKIV